MARALNPSVPPRVNAPVVGGRADQVTEDERPFAEIRRNLHDVLRMVALHRWAFFVPFCTVTSAAFLLSLYYPRTYRATTTFERRNDPIMINLPNVAGAASFQYFRSTMAQDLTSVAYVSEAVEKLGLTETFARQADGRLTPESLGRRDSLARALASRISVSTTAPSEHMDIVRLTYTGADPKIGARLLDEVKQTYVRRTMIWMGEFLESQRAYVKQQIEEAAAELAAAQKEETALKLAHPFVNPQDPGSISARLAQLEMERRDLEMRRREHSADLEALQQMLAGLGPVAEMGSDRAALDGPEPAVVFNAEALKLIGQLGEVDTKIESLRTVRGMTDEHPELKAQLTTRASIEQVLRRRYGQDVDLALTTAALRAGPAATVAVAQTWQSERARLGVQIASQQAKIKDIDISLQSNEMALEKIRAAKRDVYDLQEEFGEARERVAKARHRYSELTTLFSRIEPAIKAVGQNRLVQFSEGEPAQGSSVPVDPKARTIVLLAIIAGIVAGAVFVVLAEVLDSVYRSSGQVARSLGLPVLESIDEIVTSLDRRRNLLSRIVVAPVLVACGLGLTGVTGSLAYLSIQRPWMYQRLREIPDAALRFIAGEDVSEDPLAGHAPAPDGGYASVLSDGRRYEHSPARG